MFALQKHLKESKELPASHASSCAPFLALFSLPHPPPRPTPARPHPPHVQLNEFVASHQATHMAGATQSTRPACALRVCRWCHTGHTGAPVFQADPEDKGWGVSGKSWATCGSDSTGRWDPDCCSPLRITKSPLRIWEAHVVYVGVSVSVCMCHAQSREQGVQEAMVPFLLPDALGHGDARPVCTHTPA